MEGAHYCCIGGSYIGTLLTSVLATKFPSAKFELVDKDQAVIESLNSSSAPFIITEPGLKQLVESVKNVNLEFHSELEAAVQRSQVIFIAVESPTKTLTSGNHQSIDTSPLEQATRYVKSACKNAQSEPKIVVVVAKIPVGTCEQLSVILQGPQKFIVLCNPEFVVEGTAVENVQNPNSVIIGGPDNEEGNWAKKKLKELYLNWVDESKIIITNEKTAELSKFVVNSFLAQRVSSINSFSAICEKVDANIYQLREALCTDPRIGGNYLNPSPGFGGTRVQRDVQNLVELAKDLDLNPVADYWHHVIQVNEFQRVRLVKYIWEHLNRNLSNKKLLILGLGYKRTSSDCTNSSSLKIIVELLKEKSIISVYDPLVNQQHFLDILKEEIRLGVDIFKDEILDSLPQTVSWETDPNAGASGAHAVIILNNIEAFKDLDYATMKSNMQEPSYIFDTWDLLDHKALIAAGFKVHLLGAPPLSS